jgi:hypothetical protein
MKDKIKEITLINGKKIKIIISDPFNVLEEAK